MLRAMIRWSIRLIAILALLLGGWILLSKAMLASYIKQRQADVDLLTRPFEPPPDGKNAFASLWLSKYDVPVDQREVIAAQDVVRLAEIADDRNASRAFVSIAKSRFAARAVPKKDSLSWCHVRDEDCLSKVRANADQTLAYLRQWQGVLDLWNELHKYDYFQDPIVFNLNTPMVPLGYGDVDLPLIAAASAHVQGDRASAYAALCAHANFWRRFRAHTNSLLADMVGVARVNDAAHLYASMRDADGSGYAPDSSCAHAFSPLADDELLQCEEIRREFGAGAREMAVTPNFNYKQDAPWRDRARDFALTWTALDRTHATALLAGNHYADFCAATHRERIHARVPMPPPVTRKPCDDRERHFDFVGCRLAETDIPDFSVYYNRLLDLDAHLRLLAVADWLREQAVPAKIALARLPDNVRDARHPVEFVDNGRFLRVKNLNEWFGEWWQIPLNPMQ
jgi:hypothetical protein